MGTVPNAAAERQEFHRVGATCALLGAICTHYTQATPRPDDRRFLDFTCKRGSVGQSEGMMIPRFVGSIPFKTRELKFPWN